MILGVAAELGQAPAGDEEDLVDGVLDVEARPAEVRRPARHGRGVRAVERVEGGDLGGLPFGGRLVGAQGGHLQAPLWPERPPTFHGKRSMLMPRLPTSSNRGNWPASFVFATDNR